MGDEKAYRSVGAPTNFEHQRYHVHDVNDVCLEIEASPRGSKSASPRSCLGLNVMTSKLRYDIILHNFHPSSIHLLLCV